jgi:hypothetical protein
MNSDTLRILMLNTYSLLFYYHYIVIYIKQNKNTANNCKPIDSLDQSRSVANPLTVPKLKSLSPSRGNSLPNFTYISLVYLPNSFRGRENFKTRRS